MPILKNKKYLSEKGERNVLLFVIESLAIASSIVFSLYFQNPFLIAFIFLIATILGSSLFRPPKALIIGLFNGIFSSFFFLFYFFLEQRFFSMTPWISILPLFFPLFLFVSYFVGLYRAEAERLKQEVIKRTKELEEAKTHLEIKVKTRTRELEELTRKLDEEVKERTKELQEKVDELERFQKLTVGRELKMMKMKKEIESLKNELKKYKMRVLNN